jgi:ABC-type nitrate/sulfonate/bicarbonate transport system permease component
MSLNIVEQNVRVEQPPAVGVITRAAQPGMRGRQARGKKILRLVSPLMLLGLWELLSRVGVLDARFFPPPTELVASAKQMAVDGSLLASTADSLRRLVIGYAAGAALGVAVGLWLGLSSWSRALLEPWLIITYPIPKLALFPLLVLLVGLGEPPIIILLTIAVFYVVAINLIAGVLAIKPVILDVGRDCGASFWQTVRTVALPASLPHIMTGLEISMGIAYIVLIAAEFVGARTGLGAVIWNSWQLFDVSPMYVSIVTISVLGYGSVMGLRYLAELLMPWQKKHT